ncbi:hypothetical protein ACG04R_11120 [Roseateles sp. BYS78W]|uniref:Tetratricopeptide repeat protein n=1 Tax=Pelomonas candidula TaxID=3299025 RepID=A0ABW7HCM0_9BURK
MTRVIWKSFALAVLVLSLAGTVAAEPYTPRDDAELIERLPQRVGSAADRAAARQLRAALRQSPGHLSLAVEVSQAAINRFRSTGDPRELGQAQAALAPWWNAPKPPPTARLLRAVIRQSQHEFNGALADLDPLLIDPTTPLALRAQVELTRAAVLQVQGRWREAGEGCQRLAGPRYAALGAGVQLYGLVCTAELASLQGRTEQAKLLLDQLASTPTAPQAWISLVRAEGAERRGDPAAGALFRQARAAEGDIYSRAAEADWLVGAKRWTDAADVLLDYDRQAEKDTAALPDPLLLRLAIAWLGAKDSRAPAAVADLQARFDAATLRGDTSHGRERARFHLDVKPDPQTALADAVSNWRVQKEPADAILLVRAARAAGQPDAAAPVWAFVKETGLKDVRLGAAP